MLNFKDLTAGQIVNFCIQKYQYLVDQNLNFTILNF